MRKTSHTHTHKQDNVTNKPPKQTNKKGKKSNLGTSLSTLRHFQIALYNPAIYFYFSIFLSHRATSAAFLLKKKNPSTLLLKKYFSLALLTLAVRGGAQLAPNSTFMVDYGDERQQEFPMANP